MNKKKVSNIYGQVYGFVKESLTSLDQVYPGDHLAYERVKLYWHHVLVEDIDVETGEVKVIHYHNDVREFFVTTLNEHSLAQVKRGSIQFWSKRYYSDNVKVCLFDWKGSVVIVFNFLYFHRFYRIVYDESEVNPPEKVLELASARLGETKYNLLTDNCEHFCTECKIGKSISVQVNIRSLRYQLSCQPFLNYNCDFVFRLNLWLRTHLQLCCHP